MDGTPGILNVMEGLGLAVIYPKAGPLPVRCGWMSRKAGQWPEHLQVTVMVAFGPGCPRDPKTLGLRAAKLLRTQGGQEFDSKYLGKTLSSLAGLQFGNKE